MQELSPAGLSKDGKRLVLVSASGEEYVVTVDHRLRAALRGDHARLGQLEMKMESALRPRDIQARIRAGESPDQVAAAAQTTVEAIMGFATPVLAERAHVAQTAQKSSVRRRSTESSSAARTLGEATAANLSDLGLAADEISWDAWRREDGRWTLVADFGQQRAEFTYDMRGRYVTADNDHARLLTGELRQRGQEPAAPGRRLSAVPDQDELPLGDDAIELVREHELTVPEPEPEPEPEAVEEEPEPTAEEPTAEAPPERQPAEQQPEEPPSRSARKKGRASVPSWDEIMFGGGKGE
jgi:hypothetical protein